MLYTVPVAPDPDQAQQWVIDELSKQEYQQAKPSWIDQLVSGFWDWVDSLFHSTGTPTDAIAPVLATLVVAGLVVAAFFVFGRPRLRRTTRREVGSVFGSDDLRSASDLRASARRAHASGDDVLAIEELFRALARRLDERALVTTSPGMTAQEFVARARRPFPRSSALLRVAASHFDAVRYLQQGASERMYADVDAAADAVWDARAEQASSVDSHERAATP